MVKNSLRMQGLVERKLDRDFEKASRLGREVLESEARAEAVSYDSVHRLIVIRLLDGSIVSRPVSQIQGLANASDGEIAQVELMPLGLALRWDNLDLDFGIHGLVAGVLGTRAWMTELGRKGGSVTTEAKAAAARENGRKGGRPLKAVPVTASITLRVQAAALPADDLIAPTVSGGSHQTTNDLAKYETGLLSAYRFRGASPSAAQAGLPRQARDYLGRRVTSLSGENLQEAPANAEFPVAA